MLAYEELKGSSGRQIRFRPPRYDARRMFPSLVPRVRVRDAAYRLHDISLGGLAALSKQSHDELPEVGETVSLSIQQSGLPIFESSARVCRAENTVFGSKLAFNFIDRFIEFDKLLTRNTQAQIAARAPAFGTESAQLVPHEYRAFCADVLRLLRSYRALLESNTAIASEFKHGLNQVEAFETCEPRLIQQWRSLWRMGNELTHAMVSDRDMREATKEYTELVLTPELRKGAIWDRSYAKPLGYPGDFEIMNQVYDWERIGADAYEMLMHRVGLEVAECIRTRMEVVRTHIADVVRERGHDRAARITSLGSGPAREIAAFLSSHGASANRAEFSLIDQEEVALLYAHEATYPFVLNSDGRMKVQGLNLSFTDIIRGTDGLSGLPPQDLVYSVGLLDYLTHNRSKALVKQLYDLLTPGGLLIIGNMNDCPLSNYWPMEFISDWTLYYRNDTEMLDWAAGLNAASAWTETERTGRVRMLFVRRG
ncbi:MAG TPA: PilZ domain-containing protein [Rhizomicrobium sp.]|nr:PilZ domain-containing protein [Rhizomicrobium sp.]